MKCFEQNSCEDNYDYILESINIFNNNKFTIENNLQNITCEQIKKIAKDLEKIRGMLV